MLDFLKGRRGPGIDPPRIDVLSWFMAVELLFPGSTDIFFHAFWNPLDRRVVSSFPALKKFQIAGQAERIDSKLRRSLGLATRNELTRVRRCMVQLPLHISLRLFTAKDRPFDLVRAMKPVHEELKDLSNELPIDSAGLALALLLEAIELEDQDRMDAAREFLLAYLPELVASPGFETIGTGLSAIIRKICERTCGRSINILVARMDGVPETWAPQAYEKMLSEYLLDPCLAAETLSRAASGGTNELERYVIAGLLDVPSILDDDLERIRLHSMECSIF